MYGAKPRIALLIDHLESEYPSQIVSGVLQAARGARARTLIVPGGWLPRSSSEPVVRNFIYERLRGAKLDGIVVSAGSLSNHCGLVAFREWLASFSKVPCVAVGLNIDTVPSVFVNNETGLHQAVSHLIVQHARRKIAYIGGPISSPEAAARQAAYRRALGEHGIAVDANLMQHGALGRETGVQATNELFDQRRLESVLDAIVCMNDDVALGVLEELKRRRTNVPEAVSVVGFDNSAGARAANPPLTTVDQQVQAQAFTATNALLKAIENGAAVEGTELESRAVIRASCGCPLRFQNDTQALPPVRISLAQSCRMAVIERRTQITAELARAAAGRMVGLAGWESRILDSLIQDLATKDTASCVLELEVLARRHIGRGHGIAVFHDLLNTLRQQVVAYTSVEPAVRPRVEDLLQEARTTLSRIGSDAERDRQEGTSLRFRILSKACLSLLGSGKVSELAELLRVHLPALGIEGFSLSYRASQPPFPLQVFARRATGLLRDASPPEVDELGLDVSLEQEETLVLLPLDFDDVPVGVAALSWGAQEQVHYEVLRDLLGVAAFACREAKRPASLSA